jgi:hypothetical protein
MEKTARKPSADPVQERLRQNKTNWNKEVSAFINDLIHFKKTMNGWPSKFFKERSRIIEPVPADPATIIGALAGDFQEIVNRGNSIIQEQLNYSKTRRQKQPKQLNLPFPQPATPATPTEPPKPAPDLSKQLQLGLAADDSYYLISQASNPLSRFFTRLLTPGIGRSEAARIRRYRMSLLDAALAMYKDMKKLQSAVVGSGPESIFIASKLLDKSENSWVFLTSGFRTFVETLPGPVDTGAKIEIPPSVKGEEAPTSPVAGPAPQAAPALTDPRVVKALAAVQDIQTYSNNFRGVIGMPGLRQTAKKFALAMPDEKLQMVDAFLDEYQRMVIQVCANKAIPVQNSFAEIAAFELKTPPTTASANDQLQTVAQAFLKKLKHQISPFDKTSSFRLDIYKMAVQNKKLLDKVMDHLEEGLNKEAIAALLKEIGENMLKMKSLMQGLTSTIRGQGYQPEFINLLERGRLGDYGVDLAPKQKAELSKLLQQKQMRELVKMYGK